MALVSSETGFSGDENATTKDLFVSTVRGFRTRIEGLENIPNLPSTNLFDCLPKTKSFLERIGDLKRTEQQLIRSVGTSLLFYNSLKVKLQAANDCTMKRKRNFLQPLQNKRRKKLVLRPALPMISGKQFMSVEQDVLQTNFL